MALVIVAGRNRSLNIAAVLHAECEFQEMCFIVASCSSIVSWHGWATGAYGYVLFVGD